MRTLLLAFTLAATSAGSQDVVVIKASRMIDPLRDAAVENPVVVVRGDVIEASGTASQVTVNFSVAPSSDRVVGVWLVGGDDVQVSVVGWTTPGGAGTSNVTGFGFNPAAGDLFVTLAGNGAALGGQATQAQWSFGVADGTDQWVTGWRSEDAAAAANTARYLSTTDCLGRVASSADTWSGAAFTGYTSAGVSVNFAGAITLVAASMVVRVVGRPIDVSTFGYTSGSTTDVSTLTCPGSYLIAGHSSSTTGSVVTAASATFGLGENTTDVAVGIRDADTADPTEARRGFDATATVANPNNLSGYNHVGVANPTPTGFTVTWSTEPSAAMTFGFVAFPSNARLAATHSTAASRSATGARGAASRTALSTCH